MKRALWVALIGGLLACGWTSAGVRAADNKGNEVTIDGLKSKAPADWEAQQPNPKSGKFRKYQFRVPKAEGDKADAEVAVINLGGTGGSLPDNIKRWQGMFEAPAGKTIEEATKTETKKVGDVEVHYVDIHGAYREKFPPFDPNGKITLHRDYRRINVIFNSPNGPYFITFTGPNTTVTQHKKEFDRWIDNFK